MLTDGKSTFNVGYDRCCCHVIVSIIVVGRCYLPKDMMAKCLCDKCCSHMCLVADGNHIFRYSSVYIVTDGKSHMYG